MQQFNSSSGTPFFLSFLGRMLSLGLVPEVPLSGNDTAHKLLLRRMDSLLSDVTIFKNLTRWPGVNRTVIDVLEGLIISLSVVVAFVLVFLIREWVVQQQPLLNMQVEENNPAAAVQEHVAEVVDQLEEAEPEPAFEQVEPPESPREDFSLATPGIPEPAKSEGLSAQQRAEATIKQLPELVQQAMRRDGLGRLQEAAQIIEKLPPDEATKVKRQIVEWQRAQKEYLETVNKQLEASVTESLGLPSSEGLQETQWADSARPPLTRVTSSLAYKVKRDMEEDDASDAARSQPSQDQLDAQSRPSCEDSRPQELVPDSWDDVSPTKVLSIPSGPNAKGKSRATSVVIDANNASTSGSTPQRSPSLDLLSNNSPIKSNGDLSFEVESSPSLAEGMSYSDYAPNLPQSIGSSNGHAKGPAVRDLDDLGKDRQSPTVDKNIVAKVTQDETKENNHNDSVTISVDQSRDEDFAAGINTNSAAANNVSNAQSPPQPLVEQLLDFIYGNLRAAEPAATEPDQDDEHVVQDLADEEPFVPFAENHPAIGQVLAPMDIAPAQDEPQNQDPEVVAAAAEAGMNVNNQDVIDEAEDLEGMLELIGMQGPITGLFQNALFSAVLISISISAAVWLPYCGGKLILLLVRTPFGAWFEVPIKVISAVENFFLDLALFIFAGLFYSTTAGLRFLYTISMGMDPVSLEFILEPAKRITGRALERLGNATVAASLAANHNDHDYLHASMAAHASLKGIEQGLKDGVGFAVNTTSDFVQIARTSSPSATLTTLFSGVVNGSIAIVKQLASIEVSLPNFFVLDAPTDAPVANITQEARAERVRLDPVLAFWSARDRTLAAGLSYLTLALIGCFYLSLSPPLFRHGRIRKIEQHVTDILTQAGGVLKVILIISIEMIAFPLFCGFLLDLALLPLFENATISGRIAFAIDKPWTSGFVHWFVGTCYMFHFALFVSMCRKIMRPGVLYFIRDPDDPTFHPVRDVLERSVATQLRKIAFSAIVYGALIVLCLGGVVWGLWWAFNNVLPLHWSSSKSALEFPLDILFYNFLTPLILRYAKPSDGLHAMYKWWFRRCARFLRLSDFLFGERLLDEEGYPTDRSFLASSLRYLSLEQSSAVAQGPPKDKNEEMSTVELSTEKMAKINNGVVTWSDPTFKKTGRYVRAPATDQVRIPKGEPVFVPVTEDNTRLDNRPEDEGIHARDSTQTKLVYIPPWFTLRISAFVVTIWLFAAVTGCGITVVPLMAGRWFIHTVGISSAETKVNDIYAFSLGVYSLGGLLYLALNSRTAIGWVKRKAQALQRSVSPTMLGATIRAAGHYVLRALRVFYVWFALIVGLPLIFAAILELYLLLPLHTLSSDIEKNVVTKSTLTQHTVHLVQDWTLGVLYSRIVVKLILWDADSLLAKAAHSITAEGGVWNPNAKLATRYFILPFSLLFAVVIGGPYCIAQVANKTIFAGENDVVRTLVSRLAYPLCSGLIAGVYMIYLLTKATERWRGRIRDEVYLIGERLHNFGERKAPSEKPATAHPGRVPDAEAAEVGA